MNHSKQDTRPAPGPKRPVPQEQAPSYMEQQASSETGVPPRRHDSTSRDDGSARERPTAGGDVERERHAMPARERDEGSQQNDIRREPPGVD